MVVVAVITTIMVAAEVATCRQADWVGGIPVPQDVLRQMREEVAMPFLITVALKFSLVAAVVPVMPIPVFPPVMAAVAGTVARPATSLD